ncbi:MAG: DUF4265 domain-containing protein [Mucilaginibacter sp.]|nr:DUF4265 domain-containing protein [Mucilaginibacter sp.]
MESKEDYVKILFRYYSDVLEEETVETMWATIVDQKKGYYKIDNIPFYGPPVASDDIVFVEYDEDEQMLTYRETIEYSGNSVIQVVLMDDEVEINSVRKTFEGLGCPSERIGDKYFAIEIPASLDYKPIKAKLEQLKDLSLIDYAEPCLSGKHQY